MNWLGPDEWQAVFLSLKVAFIATLFSLPFAIATAYILARKSFFGKSVVNGIIHLPLILPPVVTGYLLLLAFGNSAPIGKFLNDLGFPFAFHWRGAALAAAIMGFPLSVRAIRLSIEAVDPKLEQAAATLGASKLAIFFSITLPLSLPGLITGALLGFAKAMGEFGATITFVANIPGETRTVPSAIYSFLQRPGGETSAVRLVIISIFIALCALLISELLAARATRQNQTANKS